MSCLYIAWQDSLVEGHVVMLFIGSRGMLFVVWALSPAPGVQREEGGRGGCGTQPWHRMRGKKAIMCVVYKGEANNEWCCVPYNELPLDRARLIPLALRHIDGGDCRRRDQKILLDKRISLHNRPFGSDVLEGCLLMIYQWFYNSYVGYESMKISLWLTSVYLKSIQYRPLIRTIYYLLRL